GHESADDDVVHGHGSGGGGGRVAGRRRCLPVGLRAVSGGAVSGGAVSGGAVSGGGVSRCAVTGGAVRRTSDPLVEGVATERRVPALHRALHFRLTWPSFYVRQPFTISGDRGAPG